jgi:hypothetical protein
MISSYSLPQPPPSILTSPGSSEGWRVHGFPASFCSMRMTALLNCRVYRALNGEHGSLRVLVLRTRYSVLYAHMCTWFPSRTGRARKATRYCSHFYILVFILILSIFFSCLLFWLPKFVVLKPKADQSNEYDGYLSSSFYHLQSCASRISSTSCASCASYRSSNSWYSSRS